jgi:hypothetical protein
LDDHVAATTPYAGPRAVAGTLGHWRGRRAGVALACPQSDVLASSRIRPPIAREPRPCPTRTPDKLIRRTPSTWRAAGADGPPASWKSTRASPWPPFAERNAMRCARPLRPRRLTPEGRAA